MEGLALLLRAFDVIHKLEDEYTCDLTDDELCKIQDLQRDIHVYIHTLGFSINYDDLSGIGLFPKIRKYVPKGIEG